MELVSDDMARAEEFVRDYIDLKFYASYDFVGNIVLVCKFVIFSLDNIFYYLLLNPIIAPKFLVFI